MSLQGLFMMYVLANFFLNPFFVVILYSDLELINIKELHGIFSLCMIFDYCMYNVINSRYVIGDNVTTYK